MPEGWTQAGRAGDIQYEEGKAQGGPQNPFQCLKCLQELERDFGVTRQGEMSSKARAPV